MLTPMFSLAFASAILLFIPRITAQAPGRGGPSDITLFKSLGIALEDIAFADLICRRAAERGIAEAHGGTIAVLSGDLGGAAFRLAVPE